MLEYPRWKYLLVALVLVLALVFALPNFFGEDPALQVERKDHTAVTADAQRALETFLTQHGVHYGKSYIDSGRLMVRFTSVPDQLAARDAVNEAFTDTYRTALSFAPRTPAALRPSAMCPGKRTAARLVQPRCTKSSADSRSASSISTATIRANASLTIWSWSLRHCIATQSSVSTICSIPAIQ